MTYFTFICRKSFVKKIAKKIERIRSFTPQTLVANFSSVRDVILESIESGLKISTENE